MSDRMISMYGEFFRFSRVKDEGMLKKTVLSSARNIRNTRTITMLGLLVALQIVLGLITTIPIGQFVRISFDFLALAVAGMLLGPVPAAVGGAIVDVLRYFMRGAAEGPYFFGITLTVALSGFIFGLALYERPVNLYRIIIAKLCVSLLANLIFNSLNLQIMYGNVTLAILTTRAIKNLFMLPIDVVLMSLVLPVALYAYRRVNRT